MKSKRIIKYGLIIVSLFCVLSACILTSQAVPTNQAGNLPSTTELGNVSVANAAGLDNTLEFAGKLVGDYRINGYTAVCNYSSMDGVAGYSGTTTKYILGNDTARAKVMYYLTPVRGRGSPSGRNNNLPSSIKGKTYKWLYEQLGYTNTSNSYYSSNYINTYADVVKAALFYQNGVSGAAAENSVNQYVVIHCLLDYIQHNGFTAPSSEYIAESAAIMLFRFISNYEGIIPNLPEPVRVFIINPYPSRNTQTLISIEYYKGYFLIQKRSSDSNITNGNSYYSLSGAEYSWYKSNRAATLAAASVAQGRSAPQNNEYVGYSTIDSSGTSNSIIPKGKTSPVSLFTIGTYYLVETKAPTGYSLSSEVRTLQITASNTSTSSRATISFSDSPLYGSITLSKSSSNSYITSDNSLYSLSGAEYTVYKDNSLQNVYAVISTANGSATLNNVPFGTYYIKETKPSNGFALDNTVHQVEINSNTSNVSVSSSEPVSYVVTPTLLLKQDTETSEPLEGAKFLVEYYDMEFDSGSYNSNFVPKKRWLFKTDSDGIIKLDNAHLVSSYVDTSGNTVNFTNDSLYYSEANPSSAVLPKGTIKITEVEAPVVIDSSGNRYKYRLDDTPTFNQVVVNADRTVVYKTVTLHNEIEGILTRTIRGEKTWNDNNNVNGNRPNYITVRLIKEVNGSESLVSSKSTNASRNWKYEFTNLPATEIVNGISYSVFYRIIEANVDGYKASYNGYNITNTEALTSVKVNKVWNDNNDQDGIRPQNVIVRLFADSVDTGLFASLSAENNWSYSFNDLPIKKNNQTINYTVEEDPIVTSEGVYNTSVSSITGDAQSGYKFTITNTHTPEKTSVVVKKKWNDTDNLDNIRPSSIKVCLKGYVNDTVVNETDSVTMTSYGNATNDSNVWSYTFTDLDKYHNGQLIDYVATELTLVNGYNLDANDDPQTVSAFLSVQEDGSYACVLENTHELKKINIDVFKVWDDDENRDGLRPNSVVVYLATVDEHGTKSRYTDESGNEVTGVLQESNGWVWNFTGLPIYDSNREVINYSVEEAVPNGYTASYSGDAANGITITNSHHESTSITVNKVWDDHDDQDGIRPNSITVNLLADNVEIDEIELNDNNNWSYTFDDLPINENGRAIKYSVTEDAITVPNAISANGYSVRYSSLRGNAQSGYTVTVTNTHTPETRNIPVSKVWSDSNNYDGIRPEQVEIKLSVSSPANTGIQTQYGYMSEENNWQYTFRNLPKYYHGVLIQYTVEESEITIPESANGYNSYIEGDMDQGFRITNSHRNEKIKLVLNKVWVDNNNLNFTRPNSAEFEITGYQGQVTTVILNESNNWHYEVRYDKYYNGIEQVPEVKEINLAEGYVSRKSVNRSNRSYVTTYEYTVTNTYEPEPTSIPVTKIWNDSNDNYEQRPEGIIVQLFVRDVGSNSSGSLRGSLQLSDDNNWQGTFNGLFTRYINGIEQEYFIREYSAHFVEELDQSTGEPTGNMILEKDDSYGQSVFNQNYIQKIEGNNIEGYTITNTFEYYRDANIPFKKIWNDDNDRDHNRPSYLDIVLVGYIGTDGGYNLSNAIEVSRRYATVTASNNWKYTFRNLPAQCEESLAYPLVGDPEDYGSFEDYNDYLSYMREIWYKVEEINIPNGYTQTLDDEDFVQDSEYSIQTNVSVCEYNRLIGYRSIAFGLVNEHTPKKTSVKVNKIWEDGNDHDRVRPASITVNLLADGVEVDDAVLNASNNWTYTFTNLNVYDNGQLINYTVTEDTFSTPAGFDDYILTSTDVTGNTENGWDYTFTNHYDPALTQVSVVKRWRDNHNSLNLRPNNLLIHLKADGVTIQTYTLSQSDFDSSLSTGTYDCWKHTFTNLPKYNNGAKIQYTIEEALTGNTAYFYLQMGNTSSTDSNGFKTFTLTNRNTTATIILKKENQNGSAIGGSEFELYFADGTPVRLNQTSTGQYTYDPSLTSYTNVITSTLGTVEISGLPPNAIVLAREITAPNSFSAYDNDIVIDVYQIIRENGLTASRTGIYTLPTITVNDYKTIMPATGGMGDYSFYILSGLVLIAALIVFIKLRKED